VVIVEELRIASEMIMEPELDYDRMDLEDLEVAD